MSIQLAIRFLGLLLAAVIGSGAAAERSSRGGAFSARSNDARKQVTLKADAAWQLNATNRFDASALAIHQGRLLTVNDRGTELFEIALKENGEADLNGTGLFRRSELMKARPGGQRFDCEGIAVDESGNLYVCEESRRLVFRASSDGGPITAHEADWSPVRRYFSSDVNASFEGIAVGDGMVYLANERNSPRIVVVDQASWKVVDSFFVSSAGFAIGGPHYSDLAYRDGKLYVLDRNHRSIYEVDPKSRKVLVEYSFARMETDPEVAYHNDYPTGAMEGLAVDDQYFWLVTDNNGKARIKYPEDTRPTLFRCRRPQ